MVVDWCRGPLAALTGDALADRRVTVRVDDVARVIAGSDPGAWDAIVLDLYEGPHQATNLPGDPLYGTRALERSRITLRPEGVLAIWSEEPDRAFEHRLAGAGFAMEKHRAGARADARRVPGPAGVTAPLRAQSSRTGWWPRSWAEHCRYRPPPIDTGCARSCNRAPLNSHRVGAGIRARSRSRCPEPRPRLC